MSRQEVRDLNASARRIINTGLGGGLVEGERGERRKPKRKAKKGEHASLEARTQGRDRLSRVQSLRLPAYHGRAHHLPDWRAGRDATEGKRFPFVSSAFSL